MSKPSVPVIFLDIDGPMIPRRATIMNSNEFGYGCLYKKFDPCAVSMLLDVLDRTEGGKLVICSTWRARPLEDFSKVIKDNGIDPSYLHEDWRTSIKLPMCSRAEQIKDWLDRHAGEWSQYAVLDDEKMDIENLVHVSYEDGMQWKHYLKLLGYLTDYGEISLKL